MCQNFLGIHSNFLNNPVEVSISTGEEKPQLRWVADHLWVIEPTQRWDVIHVSTSPKLFPFRLHWLWRVEEGQLGH